ncbi:7TM diverse intracellular signaling domain-containing protein [Pleomorphovibrio marinus]|uniref:7TM diverse intracellular signaling domain-containing protein n=1 Tax=Pleomorphovibrio marinus TaxID=2164132 RepID=UPI000E0AD87E|nr:7TM diverse intracellular signaling domain-containing protein [Pleomorphovibrio marinus]
MRNYRDLKNVLLTLFLILMVTVPIIYYVVVFGSYDGYTFQQYRYYVGEIESTEDFQHGEYFNSLVEKKVDLGVIEEPLWIKLDLKDHDGFDPSNSYYLEINSPTIRSADLFRLDGEGNVFLLDRAGNLIKDRDVLKNPNPYFILENNEKFSGELILKVSSMVPFEFDVTLSTEKAFFENSSKRTVIVSAYFGVMIALFLYNLILFFSVKDRVYLFYCFYILFIALAQLSISGHSYFILWENAWLYEVSIIGFTTLSSLFVIPFVQLFLKTNVYLPKYDKYLYLIVVSYVLALVLRLLGFIQISYQLIDLNGLVLTIAFITIGVYVAKRGDRSAYFFLLAWSFLLFGLVTFILNNLGLVDLGAYANLPLLAGTAIEALLLSFALADKINILKKEKEKEQHDKLEALKENERLIKEQNIYLEEMVKSRTMELEHTLQNLKDTQTQLVNQEKMASLGQLTAGIAHEINNPINFVSSNISPLKRDIKDILELMDLYKEKGDEDFSEQSKSEVNELEEELEIDYLITEIDQLLAGMEDGAKRTVEIVRGLKLFSRIDEQDVKEVDIHDGLDSTLILLNNSMAGRVKVIKEYGQLPMVECLAGKINQVFMNIIGNAVHAMLDHPIENREPELTISTKVKGDDIFIEIKDNGPGMPEHIREKIFEPFFTTKPVGKGTGLGLSIVYTIIENHQGTITVESETNVGTSFIIKLPTNQKK